MTQYVPKHVASPGILVAATDGYLLVSLFTVFRFIAVRKVGMTSFVTTCILVQGIHHRWRVWRHEWDVQAAKR